MGTDINVIVEYRMKNSEHFERFNYEPPCLDRNYLMFSIMADVRTGKEGKAMFEPRGFPLDRTPESYSAYSGFERDDFAVSWLSEPEYHQVLDGYQCAEGKLDFDYAVLGDLLRSLISNGAAAARIVFWFD